MNLHSLMRKAKHGLEDILPSGEEKHSHTHDGHECHEESAHAEYGTNRYCSFAPQSSGHAKWHVDGASYFWAVSMALEGEPQDAPGIYLLVVLKKCVNRPLQRPASTSTF